MLEVQAISIRPEAHRALGAHLVGSLLDQLTRHPRGDRGQQGLAGAGGVPDRPGLRPVVGMIVHGERSGQLPGGSDPFGR